MAIPESQLETWSHQGSITQSADTYRAVKNALEHSDAPHSRRDFKVFLQGSYGNDSNIYAESDVDVVIRYDGAFFHNLNQLPADQQSAFHSAYPSEGTYSYSAFKQDVTTALETAFGDSVEPGKKAIRILADGARRSADVVVAFEFRRYHKFNGPHDESHVKGLCFFTSDKNIRIANYPEKHSANCTTKHGATSKNFKPVVRIFKNMRSKLVEDGVIAAGLAPSYYIEGLLYNVPNDKFWEATYSKIVLNILNWLHATTDRTKFVCANEQYYLLRDDCETCWPIASGSKFISEVIKLWNNW